MAVCAVAGEALPEAAVVVAAAEPADVYGFKEGAILGAIVGTFPSAVDAAAAAPANRALALTLVNLGTIGAYRFLPELDGVPDRDVPEVRSARRGWGATLPKPGFTGAASTGGDGRAAAR